MHMHPWTHSHTCMHTHVCAHVSIHTYTHAIWGPLSLSPVYSHTVAGSPVLGLLFHKRLRQPAPFTLQAENVAEWFISGKGCQEHLRGKETETKGLGGGRSKGGGVQSSHKTEWGLFPRLMTHSQKVAEAPMWMCAGKFRSLMGKKTLMWEWKLPVLGPCSKGVALDEPSGGFPTSTFFLSLLFSWEVRNGAGGGLCTLRSNVVWWETETQQFC